MGNHDNNITEFSINDGFKINVSSEVTLLGIQIDEQLKFGLHIDRVCKKDAIQPNAIKRLARFMGSKERVVIVNSFILCHFNYCPLIWLFCSNASQKKLGKVNDFIVAKNFFFLRSLHSFQQFPRVLGFV